jgi:hypothetical protein
VFSTFFYLLESAGLTASLALPVIDIIYQVLPPRASAALP